MTFLGAAGLLRSAGLLADGPVVWGRPLPATSGGVFVVELPTPLPTAPLDLARIGKWIERVPELRLDGHRPTSKELAARLATYWRSDQAVLYIGSAPGSIGARVGAIQRTPLGDRRPNSAGHWLHALRGLEGCRVWWARTDAPEEYEDALLDAFAAAVGPTAAPGTARLLEAGLLLPFAVLRRPTGERRAHGITGSLLPEPVPPSPATSVRTLPPAPEESTPRSTGGRARAPRTPSERQPAAPRRGQVVRASSAAGRPGEAVHLSSEGLERVRAELDDLLTEKRPAAVRRVAAARELGDLRENSEYHAAREELGFIQGRIQALEDRLRRAVVVEGPATAHAGLGSTLFVEVDGDTAELRLVGTSEADPAAGRISTRSPVGKALIGHVAGDEVLVVTPSGAEVRYTVREVR